MTENVGRGLILLQELIGFKVIVIVPGVNRPIRASDNNFKC